MSDSKKKMQAAWAILLLLWGAFPALSSAASGSGAGSSSPASDPASDPAEEPSSEPAPDPTTDPTTDNIPVSDPNVVPEPVEKPTPEPSEYIDDPRQEDPEGSAGGVPVEDPATLPEDVPNPMDSPFGSDDNNVPLPDAISHLPDPAEWAPWMPSPREFANKVLTGASVQVSILAPTGISYETAVSASTLAAAGALVAVDGPLPIGDAAAAGIVGPGFLMQHGIDASSVPGIEVPETAPAEDTEPEPDPAGSDTAGQSASEPAPTETTETNDSTGTGGEQSFTPDSGGFATSDPDPSTEESVSTFDPTEETTSEEQEYVPGSGGTVGWPV